MLLLRVPEEITTWETVALIQCVQAANAGANEIVVNVLRPGNEDIAALLDAFLPLPDFKAESVRDLDLGRAFREVDSGKVWFGSILGVKNSLYYAPLPAIKAIQVPTPVVSRSGIVVCPFAIKNEMNMGYSVWRSVFKHLATYNEHVYLLGDRSERMDALAISEADTLGTCSVQRKLEVLANARVVIGVPNAWLWLASVWSTKSLYLIPDSVPVDRWLPIKFGTDLSMFWLDYQAQKIQMPVLLAALRKMLEAMN